MHLRIFAWAVTLLLGCTLQGAAAATLNAFGYNGTSADPNFLADHLIADGTGITRVGDAQFQGNLGSSFPDTVLNYYGDIPTGTLHDWLSTYYDPNTTVPLFSNDDGGPYASLGGSALQSSAGLDESPLFWDAPGSAPPDGMTMTATAGMDSVFGISYGPAPSFPAGSTFSAFVQGVSFPADSDPVDGFPSQIGSFSTGAETNVVEYFFAMSYDQVASTLYGTATEDPLQFGIFTGPDGAEGLVSEFDGIGFSAVEPGPQMPGPQPGSAAYFTDLDLDPDTPDDPFEMAGDGILLTSGVGTPPDTNTSTGYSGFASQQGDAGLDDLLAAAGENSVTEDATVLAFDFDLAEGNNAIHFNYMFATEEFPDWQDYNDVAAVFVDGRNTTVFPDGSGLIVNSDSLGTLLADNDPSDGAQDVSLDIEYDGVSPRQGITVPLTPGQHSIKIAVSDAGDQIYDTGFFVSDLRGVAFDPTGGNGSGSGITEGDPILPPPDDDPSDGFDLTIVVGDSGIGIDPTTPLWIDPEVAIGYIYEVTGGPRFATLTLPAGSFGDGLFEVAWWDGSAFVSLGSGFHSGDFIDFLTLADPSGLDKFRISGIEPSANVDPNNPSGFPVGVTFTGAGTANIKMTALTQNVTQSVPEPATWLLLLPVLTGLIGRGRYSRTP